MAVTAGLAAVSGLWTDVYILRRFVDMLKDELVFAKFSMPAQIPRNTGGYVARWNIPEKLRGDTTVRAEAAAGTVGEIDNTTINNVESTINTYGEWMKIGEISDLSFVTGTLDVFAEQFAFMGASEIDQLLITAAATSTNFLHSGNTTTGTAELFAGDTATITDFRTISGFFYGTNARGFSELGGDFLWAMHPNQEVDLTTEFTTTGMIWTDVNKHTEVGFAQLQKTHRLVGRYGGTTAVRTTMIGTVTEDVTAYQSIALAKWGLGWAGLSENGPTAPSIIRKRPGPQDTSQPLNMYNTIAWKVKMAAAMLDVSRVLVVYSNATVLN